MILENTVWHSFNNESVDDDKEVRGLYPVWAVFRDVWRDFIVHMGKRLTM